MKKNFLVLIFVCQKLSHGEDEYERINFKASNNFENVCFLILFVPACWLLCEDFVFVF